MKQFKRGLALLICIAMLLPTLMQVPVFAAQTQVIFADDFSGYEVGDSPERVVGAADKWNDKATSATAEVKVVNYDGSQVLCVTNSADKTGGPRLGKILYLKDVDDLTVSFRAKTVGSATVGFSVMGGKTEAFSRKGKADNWISFKAEIDLKNKTYVIYANGQRESKGDLAADLTAEAVYIRFGGSVSKGGCTYYDDITMTTNTDIDIAKLSDAANVTGSTAETPSAGTTPSTPAVGADHTADYKTAAAVKKYAPSSNTVIFEDDFNLYAAGEAIQYSPDTLGAWTERAVSATATITAEDKDADRVLQVSNTSSSGGPRLGKTIYPAGVNTVYISFMVRTEGSATVGFSVSNGTTNGFNVSGTQATWAAYEYMVDLNEKTYVRYKNGVQDAGGPLGADLDSQMTFRFGGSVKNGGCTFYDNIKISTPDEVDLQLVHVGSAGEMVTKAQHVEKAEKTYAGEAAQAVSTPSDAIQLFYYDNNKGGESISLGTSAAWSKLQTSETLKASTVSNNELILAVNPRAVKMRSALTKSLSLGEKAKDLTVEYSVYFIGNSGARFGLMANATNDLLSKTPEISAAHPLAKAGWNHMKYTLNMEKKTYSSWINGAVLEENAPFAVNATNYADVTAVFNFINNNSEEIVLLDNVVMYTYTPVVYSTLLYGSEGVNWDMVKGSPITEKSFVSNLRAHPRVLINSWDEIREKVTTDKTCAQWFANVTDYADGLLDSPNIPYVFDNGRNWLSGARNVRTRLFILSFMYGVTNDRKYLERALEEMRYAATHPDWSNSAPIISSECMMGFAIAYDWLYYGLSEDEKAEIRKAICDKALWQFIHSYEGKSAVEIGKGTSNRTTVANSCGLMTAVAIADEMPEVANYVYENALKHARLPILAYSEDGGFPEGTMYWEYSTRFAVLLMSTLQSAPVEGYVHDEAAQWFFDRPQMKNTPKYNIYLNSTNQKFNFGDANDALVYSPTLYWFASFTGEPFYKWYENDMLEKHQATYQGLEAAQAIIWYDTDMPTDGVESISPDALFNSETAAVATMRSSFADTGALFAALQGGSNSTGHMHKSLGNFAIDANGQRFISTVGASNYGSQFDTSYYYVRRTEGQNTILFNPDASVGQTETALAMFTDFKSDEDEAYAVLDMSQTHESVESAQRGMFMTKGRRSVVIQDEFKMKKPSEIYWFAQTLAEITLAQDGMSALLTRGGERMLVVLSQAPAGAKLSVMEAKPLPTSPVAADEIHKTYYKLAVHLLNTTEGTIRVEFIPLEQGETPSVAKATTPQPISAWALDSTVPAPSAHTDFGGAVALKLGSPVAFANGQRTYVDTSNYAVMPVETGGRTLVPVRFISEKIGGIVSWNDALQQVKIQRGEDQILLHIGSNEMLVNGQSVLLDVPAQTINDRTMIPLRAMVEAIGKSVFWDDRGLILITGDAQSPSEEEIVRMLGLLDTRVLWGSSEVTWFDANIASYTLTPQADNTIRVLASGAEIPVVQDENGASFTLNGNSYTIRFAADTFDGLLSTADPRIISNLAITPEIIHVAQARNANYIPVQNVEMSTGHDKYIPQGTIDNIINEEIINRWSGYGAGAFLQYDLGYKQNLHSFGLAVLNGTTRETLFSLSISDDGETWTEVLNTKTHALGDLFEIFKLGDVQARYVKVIGYGTPGGNMYNSWTEVRFWASAEQEAADQAIWSVEGLNGTAAYHVGDQLRLAVTATNNKGVFMDATGTTFTTDKEGVVSIAPDGTLTVIGEGSVKVTATYHNGFKNLTAVLDMSCEK